MMPLRDIVIFPTMVLPLFVGRNFSIKAVEEASKKDSLIFLTLQKEKDIEEPKEEELYHVGVIAHILRVVPIEESRIKVLVQGIKRGVLKKLELKDDHYVALVEPIEEKEIEEKDLTVEDKALMKSVKELLDKAISLGKQVIPDVVMIIREIEDPGKLADLIASILEMKSKEAQEILETIDPRERLRKVHQFLLNEVGLLEVKQQISTQAREQIEKEQREYFLRQQLRAIQEELGETDERRAEIEEYRKKLEELKLEGSTRKEIEKQIKRLERLHPDSAEAGVLRTWLDWVLELPWNKRTEDNYDLDRAKEILDRDHYDLEKVKDRIIEYLAVRKLTEGGESTAQILAFVGPPGVGKTSLGKSIAEALGRKFVRIALGGIRDEAEIRGHRRTYVGAMPGRIIQAIKQAGTKNPLIMLDEIDKLAMSFQGDPASALLEVLDPEQNKNFTDLYIGLPFDLSEVIFICTGNRMDTIPTPLLDRMELIQLSGYSEEEKLFIAQKHLLPKLIPLHGLKEEEIQFEDEAILEIIRGYTREAGVRNLQRQISSVLRKIAVKKLKGEEGPFRITKEDIRKLLGVPRYKPEREREPLVGIATGLAWTEVGGEIMFIEATKMKGKGGLLLTGSLGDIMKESAQAALSYIRSNAENYGIDPDVFPNIDIHIHVPEGAVPKDGPSAGVALATALISLLTDIPVRSDIAMTGEITLRGRVLPVGGLKEKILAAKRAGIYEVILPEKNRDEVLEDLPEYVREQMKLHFVRHLDEVFSLALTKGEFSGS
ncbi:endopeptidase La [Hydrogenivirga sp. 128-5-R1-1]|uniref:endopeptidase La n=1 Tax=Hydrogenivirga sp. 128-5-R1-1 TaxID=392423 RepID=UPI00015EF976|nr:endopeptidase La [Hydrogenivirga sp. 128-5-R1-1]EDP74556.1 Lon protease [Hydrogenivirga sp. 128-5-R1-1]